MICIWIYTQKMVADILEFQKVSELLPYVKRNAPKPVYHLTIHSDTDECIGEPKLFAACIFDKILDDIGLRSFVGTFKNYDKIHYDVLGFLKLNKSCF